MVNTLKNVDGKIKKGCKRLGTRIRLIKKKEALTLAAQEQTLSTNFGKTKLSSALLVGSDQ